jgi:kynureninase
VADFRPPDVMRLAPAAPYTRYVDAWDAADCIASVLRDPALHEGHLKSHSS